MASPEYKLLSVVVSSLWASAAPVSSNKGGNAICSYQSLYLCLLHLLFSYLFAALEVNQNKNLF